MAACDCRDAVTQINKEIKSIRSHEDEDMDAISYVYIAKIDQSTFIKFSPKKDKPILKKAFSIFDVFKEYDIGDYGIPMDDGERQYPSYPLVIKMLKQSRETIRKERTKAKKAGKY